MRACTADITLSVRSRIASVVPTGAWALMSLICRSAADAKRRPSSIILSNSPAKTMLGSLYGSGTMLSRIVPEGTSTSLNSPGAIGVSSPLVRNPRVLKPPGRFESDPASTSWRSIEVPDLAKAPIR